MNERALGHAAYRQGEVHRLQGDFEAAEAAYREASRFGREPQPGLALLRLSQGNGNVAAAAIRRALSETTPPLKRAALLPAYVEVMLAVGESTRRAPHPPSSRSSPSGQGSDALGAMSAHARGAVDLAGGDAGAALVALRRAWQAWQDLEAPYEAARTRVLAGLACSRSRRRRHGRCSSSRPLAESSHSWGHGRIWPACRLAHRRRRASATHGLTARELQVLRLVAAGKSNREIAVELFISDHTARRHLQNIFRKVGVSSRAAATAFAFRA